MAGGHDWSAAGLLAQQDPVFALVHDSGHGAGGSISAEHGVGQPERGARVRYMGPIERAFMRSVKRALDSRGITNPGKVLAVASA